MKKKQKQANQVKDEKIDKIINECKVCTITNTSNRFGLKYITNPLLYIFMAAISLMVGMITHNNIFNTTNTVGMFSMNNKMILVSTAIVAVLPILAFFGNRNTNKEKVHIKNIRLILTGILIFLVTTMPIQLYKSMVTGGIEFDIASIIGMLLVIVFTSTLTILSYEISRNIFKKSGWGLLISYIILLIIPAIVSLATVYKIEPAFKYIFKYLDGYIPLIDSLIYILVSVFFWIVSNRLNKENNASIENGSQVAFGANKIIQIALSAIIAVGLVISIQLGLNEKNSSYIIDTTKGSIYTLSKEVIEEAKKLDRQINISLETLKFSEKATKEELESEKSLNSNTHYELNRAIHASEILALRLQKLNSKISYTRKTNASENKLTFEIPYGEKEKKKLFSIDPTTELVIYDRENRKYMMMLNEYILNVLKQANSPRKETKYGLITGSSLIKLENIKTLYGMADSENIKIEKLAIDEIAKKQDEYEAIILFNDVEDISEKTAESLLEFAKQGKNILIFNTPIQKAIEGKNINKLLYEFGINIPSKNIVLEQSDLHRFNVEEKKEKDGKEETIKHVDNTMILPEVSKESNTAKLYNALGLKGLKQLLTIGNGRIIKDTPEQLKERKIVTRNILETSSKAKAIEGYKQEYANKDIVEDGIEGVHILGVESERTFENNKKSVAIVFTSGLMVADQPIGQTFMTSLIGNRAIMQGIIQNLRETGYTNILQDTGLKTIAITEENAAKAEQIKDSVKNYAKTLIMFATVAFALIIWESKLKRMLVGHLYKKEIEKEKETIENK